MQFACSAEQALYQILQFLPQPLLIFQYSFYALIFRRATVSQGIAQFFEQQVIILKSWVAAFTRQESFFRPLPIIIVELPFALAFIDQTGQESLIGKNSSTRIIPLLQIKVRQFALPGKGVWRRCAIGYEPVIVP